jgi:hypothetical protein
MALESMSDSADPAFRRIADRLTARVVDYSRPMPSAQRRFIMPSSRGCNQAPLCNARG